MAAKHRLQSGAHLPSGFVPPRYGSGYPPCPILSQQNTLFLSSQPSQIHTRAHNKIDHIPQGWQSIINRKHRGVYVIYPKGCWLEREREIMGRIRRGQPPFRNPVIPLMPHSFLLGREYCYPSTTEILALESRFYYNTLPFRNLCFFWDSSCK
ncbi:hypothetical protein ABFS82_10G121300 [Erythranthe guttata]